ncbi:MAG: AIR carboxylase family protein, partial [Nocardioidaceae bacterium]
LAGVVAAYTTVPVLGVPIESQSLKGLDSLLSMVQMPAGVPVATVAIGNARNAGLLAVRILAVGDLVLRTAMQEFQQRLAGQAHARGATVRDNAERVQGRSGVGFTR